MTIVINLLMVLLVALCLLMLLIILMQRPKQEGLGAAFGGGMMDGMLGAGTTSFLQKGTVYLTVGYFILTMTLAVIQARTSEARSKQGLNLEATAEASATPTPAEEGATGGSLEPTGPGDPAPPVEPLTEAAGEPTADPVAGGEEEKGEEADAPVNEEEADGGETAPEAGDPEPGAQE